MKKVWIYARIRNAALNDELKRQLQGLRAYAAEKKYEIAGESGDCGPGHSWQSPGLLAANKAIEEGRADAILVHKSGRVFRDSADILKYMDFLKAHHVELISMTEGNLSSPLLELAAAMTARNPNENILKQAVVQQALKHLNT